VIRDLRESGFFLALGYALATSVLAYAVLAWAGAPFPSGFAAVIGYLVGTWVADRFRQRRR
jgi:hypothetical protein